MKNTNETGSRKSEIISYGFLAERRPKDALPPLVKFGHDHVLGLVSAGLGREVDDVGFVRLLVQLVQQKVLQKKQNIIKMDSLETKSGMDYDFVHKATMLYGV